MNKQTITIRARSSDDLDTVIEFLENALQDLKDSGMGPVDFYYDTGALRKSNDSLQTPEA